MYSEFTALKYFFSIKFICMFILILISVINVFKYYPLLGFIIISAFFIMQFRDYKVIIDKEKIHFFRLYRKNRILLWSDISIVEIEKRELYNFFFGFNQRFHIYIKDDIYSFNISPLEKEQFYQQLIKICVINNVRIVDLRLKN